jgi:hypothetical protein
MLAPRVLANSKQSPQGPRPLFFESMPFYKKTPRLWLICARHSSSTSEQREGETRARLGWQLTGGKTSRGGGQRVAMVDDELDGALGFANGDWGRSVHAGGNRGTTTSTVVLRSSFGSGKRCRDGHMSRWSDWGAWFGQWRAVGARVRASEGRPWRSMLGGRRTENEGEWEQDESRGREWVRRGGVPDQMSQAWLLACPRAWTRRDTEQGATHTHPWARHLAVASCPTCRHRRDKWGPRSVAQHNFDIGIRVIQWLDFEIYAFKIWFVSTAQNSGNQASNRVKTCQMESKVYQIFIGHALSNYLQLL